MPVPEKRDSATTRAGFCTIHGFDLPTRSGKRMDLRYLQTKDDNWGNMQKVPAITWGKRGRKRFLAEYTECIESSQKLPPVFFSASSAPSARTTQYDYTGKVFSQSTQSAQKARRIIPDIFSLRALRSARTT
jgi:hypothetical protein